MLDKKKILKAIDGAYKARSAGDNAAMATYWAPGATFRLAADAKHLKGVPVKAGAVASVNKLMEQFRFKGLKRVDAVVEGNSAAVHWKVKVTNPAGKSAQVELYDLWKFNKAGKAVSLMQFTDTATLRSLL